MSRLQERIENFNKAFELFNKMQKLYILNKKNDSNRLALTQSFEITFEIAWKTLKDYLYTKAIEVYTPKDVIKSAFAANILPDGQIWIDMANAKNASSHEYNADKIDILLEKVSSEYYNELYRFNEWINKIYE